MAKKIKRQPVSTQEMVEALIAKYPPRSDSTYVYNDTDKLTPVDFSMRGYLGLRNLGYTHISQLVNLRRSDLRNRPNVGKVTIATITKCMQVLGIPFKSEKHQPVSIHDLQEGQVWVHKNGWIFRKIVSVNDLHVYYYDQFIGEDDYKSTVRWNSRCKKSVFTSAVVSLATVDQLMDALVKEMHSRRT